MNTETAWTVGAVARLAGVTVRTLHHYDEIGLASSAERTDAGYRLYSRLDIERLQEVLFFRELGIGLTEFGESLRSRDTEEKRRLEVRESCCWHGPVGFSPWSTPSTERSMLNGKEST